MNTSQNRRPTAGLQPGPDRDGANLATAKSLLLTTRQAAAYLAMTPLHLAALRATGHGPAHYRTPIGAAIYFVDDLHDWSLAADIAAPAPPTNPGQEDTL